MRRFLSLAVATSLLVTAAAAVSAAATPARSKTDKTTITLVTHDSFKRRSASCGSSPRTRVSP
jgi:hypothetical protein